jgi:ABC-type phosphate transport system substrate-binding protein
MSAFKQSMRKLGVRAGLLAGTSLAVVAIAGIGAGSASAACSSTIIKGQGSSLQRVAQQEIWTTGYISGGCGTGTNFKPEYTSSSSGTGMSSWGSTGGAITREWTYIGTDDGPNPTQIGNMKTAAGAGSNLVVTPVAQTAIAIMVHPPAECSITTINNVNLEKAFSGEATTWSAIGATGAGCSGSLTRVVRKDASGTTYQFKNYLALINQQRNGGTEKEICPAKGTWKWSNLEEISGSGGPNLEWPECGTIAATTPTGTGGGEVAAKVAATAGTIGYAALPDAKAKSATTIKVQNNGVETTGVVTAAPNKGTEEANCASAEYTVPAEGLKASGTGLNVDWSKVFGGQPKIGGEVYPICTLTYDLGWNNYVTAGFAAGIGSSVKSYLNYIITNGTGTGTVKKWYSNLPTKTGEGEAHNVKQAAEFAVEKVN